MKSRGKKSLLAAASASVAALLALAPAAVGSASAPSGYTKTVSEHIGTGLDHVVLRGQRPVEVAHVARVAPGSSFDLRVVPSNGSVGHGLERTSSICIRVKCAVAINGDFFGPQDHLPIGAVVSLGQLLHSPSADHAQLTLSRNGILTAGPLRLTATLVTTDLRTLRIDALNTNVRTNDLVLYTPAYGSHVKASKGSVEVVLRAVRPEGPIALSKTTVVAVSQAKGRQPHIPLDGGVLVGRGQGAARINDLLSRIRGGSASKEALLRVESPTGAIESIGGGPILVRNGVSVVPDEKTNFFRGRHPRTIVGWTRAGEILLVTVDGRQPGRSVGMTLEEAARFMIGLGAKEAMNLDGGGSTTFVRAGRVVNTPSDRAIKRGGRVVVTHEAHPGDRMVGFVERPVATALVVVPKKGAAVPTDRDFLRALEIPQVVHADSARPGDVASDPRGSEPAIVVPVRGHRGMGLPVTALALTLFAAVLATSSGRIFRPRNGPNSSPLLVSARIWRNGE